MQTHIAYDNKIASFGTVGLLFLAGISGIVFLLPAQAAHAAGPTVTLSASSGVVGSFITITGGGFAPAHDVGIEFRTTVITTFGQSSGYPTIASLLDTVGVTRPLPLTTMTPCAVAKPCIETDANGWFQAIIPVPPGVGGAQTVSVTDGITSATTSFTINPNVVISESSTSESSLFTSGFPDQSVGNLTVEVTGFAASDTVVVSSTAFRSPLSAITTGSATASPNTPTSSRSGLFYTSGPGIGIRGMTLAVAEVAGGKVAVIATGASGLTAATSFTINPIVAIFGSQTGGRVFSMLQTGELLLAGYGFPAGTVAANSITITTSSGASVTTVHTSVTVGSTGAFGQGGNNHLLVIPTAVPPTGPASIVITDGTTTYTFNYANHNIAAAGTTDSAGNALPYSYTNGETSTSNPITVIGSLAYNNSTTVAYGWPFIISAPSTSSSQTGIGYVDASSYQPNNGKYVTVMGADFAGSAAAAAAPAVTFGAGTNTLTFGTERTDSNGAFFLIGTGVGATSCSGGTVPVQNGGCFNDEPYSSSETNRVTVTIPPTGLTVGSVLEPTIHIAPWISLSGLTTTTFQSAPTTVTYHGFTATDSCTLTVAGTSLSFNAGACTIGTNGNVGPLNVVSSGLATADLPGGAFTATGSDGVVTATAGGFVLPTAVWGGTAATTALSCDAAAPGTIIILRSSTTFGVHGLAPNTAYSVVIDPGQSGQVTLSTFTSSAAGQIPAPGVQFAVPSVAGGFHTVTLMSGTTNVFWDDFAASTDGGTSLSTTATTTDSAVNNPVAGAAASTAVDPSNNQVSSQGALNSLRGQYGDLVLSVGAPPSTYCVTFDQTGIPGGVTWGVTVGGTLYTGTGGSIAVAGITGTRPYSYESTVAGAAGVQYVSSCSGSVSAAGTQSCTYTTQYQVSFAVSPSGSGTTNPSATAYYTAGTGVPVSATASSGHAFSSWSNGVASITFGNSASSSTTATINGPGTITADFSSATTYSVTFTESGLTSGTQWSVTFDGDIQSSSATTIAFTGIANGVNYAWSLTPPSGYTTSSQTSGLITVSGANVNQPMITFAPITTAYSVAFDQTGIPGGVTWGVTVGGTLYTGTGGSIAVTGITGTVAYSYDSLVAGAAGVQYVSSCSGSVSGAVTSPLPCTYTTQYQVSFAVNPGGAGTTNPSGSDVWENETGLPVTGTPNVGFAFGNWSASNGAIVIGNAGAATTTVTIAGAGTLTANFVVATQPVPPSPRPFPWTDVVVISSIVVASVAGLSLAVRQSKLPPRPNNPRFTVAVTVASIPKERGEKPRQ
jgi:hypothetical protein